jgi:RNA polymerase sigma factor (sigma-70 family)
LIFEHLYKEYKTLVFNLALQYANNVEDAEEIMQDVFVNIYQHLNSFRQEADIKTWIYRITINQSLDFIKKKQRKKRSFFANLFGIADEKAALEATDFNHPGVDLENKEAIQLLMSKIHALPENQKTAVILLKIEGLSQQEVAQIMNLKEGAVESLLQRAKINLKKKL